jgi:hypothetical protein
MNPQKGSRAMPKKVLIGNSVLLAVAALCVPIFLSACLYVAYPSVSYAPGVNVGEQHEEVHCFRIDSDEKTRTKYFATILHRDKSFAIKEIPVSAKGRVPGQMEITIESGWVGLGTDVTEHSICLVLYRRGYEVEEIHSWPRIRIAWRKLANAKDREKAIDKLISLKRFEPRQNMFHYIDEHDDWSAELASYKPLLKLAALEYEALSNSDLGDEPDREMIRKRLLEKVQKLNSILSEVSTSRQESD